MDRNNETIRLAKKAADAWRNTDTYHQAAQIIDMLISALEGDPTLPPPNAPLMLAGRLTPKMVTCPKGWKGGRRRWYCTRFSCNRSFDNDIYGFSGSSSYDPEYV